MIAAFVVAAVVVCVLAEWLLRRGVVSAPLAERTTYEPSHIRACNKCGSRPSYVDEGEACMFSECGGVYVKDGGLPPDVAPPVEEPPRDPAAELASLLAAANERAGGTYLAINVGPSRHERRAAKAIERKTRGRAVDARQGGLR